MSAAFHPSDAHVAARPARVRLPPDLRIAQVLDAALVEFSARGFAATRMDDIARRCELSKGGLYAHFRNKEELFEALLSRSLSPADLSEMALSGPLAPRKLAEWLVEQMHASLAQPAAIATLRLLIAESERVPHLVALWWRNVVEPQLRLLGEILRKNVGRRGGRTSILVREPWLVISPVVHAMVSQLLLGPRADIGIAQYRRAHVALLCELLEAADSAPSAGSRPVKKTGG
jgi:AcrR family transcriptional regulator